MSQLNVRLMQAIKEQQANQAKAGNGPNMVSNVAVAKTMQPKAAKPANVSAGNAAPKASPKPSAGSSLGAKKLSAGADRNIKEVLQDMLHDKMGRKAAIAAAEILGEPVCKRRRNRDYS